MIQTHTDTHTLCQLYKWIQHSSVRANLQFDQFVFAVVVFLDRFIYLHVVLYLCMKSVRWRTKCLRTELKHNWNVTNVCVPVETGSALLWPALVRTHAWAHVKKKLCLNKDLLGWICTIFSWRHYLYFRWASGARLYKGRRRGRRNDRRRVEQESGWAQRFTGGRLKATYCDGQL